MKEDARDQRNPLLSREVLLVLLVLLVGILARHFGHSIPPLWLGSVVAELGLGCIIAAILALLVDRTLKAGLIKDAFETTFGYVLPDELKGELQWIYDQKVLCEQHHSHFEISTLEEDDRYVIVRETYDRTFKNIGNGTIEFSPSLAIDDWNHPVRRKSRIVLLGYEADGRAIVEEEGVLQVERVDFGVLRAIPKHERILLSRNETIRVWGVYEEVQSVNDHHVSVFLSPTCEPHVRVTCDASIEARVTFGHREKVRAKDLGPGVRQLEGLLLPNQAIRIEWRKRKDSELPQPAKEADDKH
jgi:hypothetical protein